MPLKEASMRGEHPNWHRLFWQRVWRYACTSCSDTSSSTEAAQLALNVAQRQPTVARPHDRTTSIDTHLGTLDRSLFSYRAQHARALRHSSGTGHRLNATPASRHHPHVGRGDSTTPVAGKRQKGTTRFYSSRLPFVCSTLAATVFRHLASYKQLYNELHEMQLADD